MKNDTKNLGEHICSAEVAGDRSAEAVAAAPHAAPKHTPGPWQLMGSGDNRYIGQTAHLTRDVWVIPRTEADWHLIAAAPEMYEALKEAKKHISGSAPVMIRLWEQVDAALRKAEGRQP